MSNFSMVKCSRWSENILVLPPNIYKSLFTHEPDVVYSNFSEQVVSETTETSQTTGAEVEAGPATPVQDVSSCVC